MSIVWHFFSGEFDISKYRLCNQRSLCGMYLYVYLLQYEEIILIAEEVFKDPGKILNIFVCERIICQLDLVGHCMQNIDTGKVKFS